MKPTLAAALFLAACATANAPPERDPIGIVKADPYEPQPYVRFQHVDWAKDAVIYEMNVRQFSQEGTFAAAQAQLPRLKELGVDILWLMPIHPIGEENRKGRLGSYYSVRDYKAVNPEFGTEEDFRRFVDAAHAQGLHVILDWVANHTAWDHPWVEEHPDWYERDWKGDFHPTPWWDWSDIIDLDYSKPGVRAAMADAMRYWVREFDVDGYRCDVAGYVPIDFWEHVRTELDAIKPVFMLAEWDTRDLHARAFDMTYAWPLTEAMTKIARGEADTGALYGYYSADESAWPEDAIRMSFVTNHDENSWNATSFDRYGAALEAMIVLTHVGDGMPLVYSGEEAGNDKQLAFFERDPIAWRDHPNGELYRKLAALIEEEEALWHGHWGGKMVKVENSDPTHVFSFVRERNGSRVLAVMNLSDEPRSFAFTDALPAGRYEDFETGEEVTVAQDAPITLGAWEWQVLR